MAICKIEWRHVIENSPVLWKIKRVTGQLANDGFNIYLYPKARQQSMSEQLYFFKFNKEIARTKLSALINKDDSYNQFLFENFKSEEKVQFNNIINKIDENVELLSIDELWSLFDWFTARVEKQNPHIENYNLDNQRDEEMCHYGLDLFYEIPSKTPVRNFHRNSIRPPDNFYAGQRASLIPVPIAKHPEPIHKQFKIG